MFGALLLFLWWVAVANGADLEFVDEDLDLEIEVRPVIIAGVRDIFAFDWILKGI